jgi:putative nucleotidyltransferase with HDIG domain
MSHGNTDSTLGLALGNLDILPAMPAIAHKLLALALDTDEGEAQMLSLIGQDPQLSAKIIGLANSPAMGIGRSVHSIHDAAMLLGLQRLKSVSIGVATLTKLTNRPASKHFDPQNLWSHSITIAIVMNLLAQAMPEEARPGESQTFLAGLLHDIGLMALHHLDFAACDELHHQLRLQPKRSIYEIEMELLGTTHGHIGAQLAQYWNLPAEIVAVLEHHHAAQNVDAAPANLLARMINISERLLLDFGMAEHHKNAISDNEWQELGIAPERASDIVAMVSEVAIQVVQLPETEEVSRSAGEPNKPATPKTVESAPPAPKGMMSWLGRMLH